MQFYWTVTTCAVQHVVCYISRGKISDNFWKLTWLPTYEYCRICRIFPSAPECSRCFFLVLPGLIIHCIIKVLYTYNTTNTINNNDDGCGVDSWLFTQCILNLSDLPKCPTKAYCTYCTLFGKVFWSTPTQNNVTQKQATEKYVPSSSCEEIWSVPFVEKKFKYGTIKLGKMWTVKGR